MSYDRKCQPGKAQSAKIIFISITGCASNASALEEINDSRWLDFSPSQYGLEHLDDCAITAESVKPPRDSNTQRRTDGAYLMERVDLRRGEERETGYLYIEMRRREYRLSEWDVRSTSWANVLQSVAHAARRYRGFQVLHRGQSIIPRGVRVRFANPRCCP